MKNFIITIKNFLEAHDVQISQRKFKLKVKLPRIIRNDKESLSKGEIIEILNACSDIRLRTYVLLLASTGMRAVEALSMKINDIDFDSEPAKINLKGKYTKTKSGRTIFLTEETKSQLNSWLDYKYRTRRVCHENKKEEGNRKTITEYRTPQKKGIDLVFSVHQYSLSPNPQWIYTDIIKSFAKTLDRMGKGERERERRW